DQRRWPEARASASRARDLLAGRGVRPGLRRRVEGAWAELTLVDRLHAIRLRQAEVDIRASAFDRLRMLPEYGEAFQGFGLDPQATEAETAVERIAGLPEAVRGAVLAGLDEWLDLAGRRKAPERGWLARVLAAADPDPWRSRVRRAAARKDRRAL